MMDPRLASYIATRDRRIAKDQPWSPTPLAEYFGELSAKGFVTVGGRASCGGRADPTWTAFTLWGEVVRKALAMGYQIETADIKHGNGSPTRSGGFWNEREYRLTGTPESS